jgi:hypothetical protein
MQLAYCALAIGVGILLLIGFLVTARELFAESIFGAPQEPDEEAGRAWGAARSRHERTALQP